MMKAYFAILLSLYFTASCTVEYNMKPAGTDEPDRLAVNGFLIPEKPVRIHFYTVDRTAGAGFAYHAAENLHVKLTEDGRTLFDGLCADSVLSLDVHPKTSATYRIDVSHENYEPVWAETTIPAVIRCKAKAKEFGYSEMKISLSDFEGGYAGTRSAFYLTAFTVFEDDTVMQSNDLYASNVLIDKMNRSNGTEVKDEDIGSAYYEGFIRVKNHNIPHIDSLLFITHISSIHYFADGEFHQKKRKSFLVKTITAGPEYDRYMRTFYQQTANVVYDDDISAIVYQPVQVYSNINGGLGIFAGINAVNYYFDIPAKE